MKILIRPFLLCLLLLSFSAFPASAERKPHETFVLDEALKPEIFLDPNNSKLLSSLQTGPFGWVSQEKTELRGAGAPMTFLGLPVLEIVFRFKSEKLSEIFISFYNRGDAGEITDDAFASLIAKTEEALNARSAASSEELGDTLKKVHIRSQSKGWLAKDNSYRLDTAFSRVKEEGAGRRTERPEFINLTILPGGLKREDLLVQRGAEAGSTDLAQRVQHLPEGDVLLKGIPMVDQGQKGYCAVATMERILRYYGSEVNQHELAQQANSGEEGTDPESLLKALRGMGGKLGLRVNEKMGFDSRDFLDLVEDYNRAAKRKKLSGINLSTGQVIIISEVYAKMNPEIFRELRLKSANKVQKFMETVAESVDQGRPVAWSVMLGFVEETPKLPQGGGGHMRLIIGYNRDKKEILYSDSWGYGHELKRMTLDDAYTITTGLYTVDPRPGNP